MKCKICGRYPKWIVNKENFCGYHAKVKKERYSIFSKVTINLFNEIIKKAFFGRTI